MTQPPYQQQPYPQQPDRQPPPGWAPNPYQNGQQGPRPGGYDPSRPLGAPRPDATNIASFAPPRSKAPLLASLAVVVVAIVIAVTTALQPGGLFGTPAAPTPSPTPSATPTLPGHPFISSDRRVEGRWEVIERRWTDEGVQVKLRVAVDSGTLRFSFLAFPNDASEVVYPAPGADTPEFGDQPIERGEQREGWLFFPAYRADMTVILASETGRQISALVVAA